MLLLLPALFACRTPPPDVPPPPAIAVPLPAPRSADTARFRAPAGSHDLLCAIARAAGTADSAIEVTQWAEIRSAPELAPTAKQLKKRVKAKPIDHTCDCGDGPPVRCQYPGVGDIQKRATVLPPSKRVRLDLEAADFRRLRLALRAYGDTEATPVRVAVRAEEQVITWDQPVSAEEAWVEVDLDLTGFSGAAATVEIDVGPDASVAVGAPRVITHRTGDKPPSNVLVYLVDTLRPDHMSAHGYPRATTPNIDRFFSSGLIFDNAWSTAPWTRPATASLLTSLHPTTHGAIARQRLRSDVETLAERFRAAGWSTWAFIGNGNVFGRGLSFEQGFDHFESIPGVNRDNNPHTDEVNARVLPWLSAHQDEPFFAYVHVVDPHAPYRPPRKHRSRFSDPNYAGPVKSGKTLRRNLKKLELGPSDFSHVRGLYDDDVAYQDAMFGQFVDGLPEVPMVTVLTSDHGEEFYEHGSWEHTYTLYEELLRVPLMVRFPGEDGPRGRSASAVQLTDVMPSLYAWVGLGPCDGCDGTGLLAPTPTDVGPRPVFAEEVREDKGFALRSIRVGDHKLIVREGTEPFSICFDLVADPGEQNPLPSDAPGCALLIDPLRAHTSRNRMRQGDPTGSRVELDAETRQNLEALGYVDP